MKKLISLIFVLFAYTLAFGLDQNEQSTYVSGFRVCVYNGTQQNARTLANQALAQVNKAVSSTVVTKLVYDAPVFKVFVGACINKIEATMLLHKLQKVFPNAFIVNDKINLTDFVGTPSMVDDTLKPQEE